MTAKLVNLCQKWEWKFRSEIVIREFKRRDRRGVNFRRYRRGFWQCLCIDNKISDGEMGMHPGICRNENWKIYATVDLETVGVEAARGCRLFCGVLWWMACCGIFGKRDSIKLVMQMTQSCWSRASMGTLYKKWCWGSHTCRKISTNNGLMVNAVKPMCWSLAEEEQ